jgi:hypothetical protein
MLRSTVIKEIQNILDEDLDISEMANKILNKVESLGMLPPSTTKTRKYIDFVDLAPNEIEYYETTNEWEELV